MFSDINQDQALNNKVKTDKLLMIAIENDNFKEFLTVLELQEIYSKYIFLAEELHLNI